jgi:proliferating cell nuclear antigen
MKVVFEGADVFKKSIKAIGNIVDEGVFVFDEEGMKLRATDPSKIAMVDFLLPKHAFREYEVPETTKIGMNIDDMLNALKRVKSSEEVHLSLSEDGSRLTIELIGKARRKFVIPVLDIGGAELPTPKLAFTATAKVIAEVVQNAFKDADAFSSHVTLDLSDDTFTIKASGTKGEYVLELKKDVHDALLDLTISEPARASYPLDYLEDMISEVSKTAAITLSLRTDAPLKLGYNIGDASFVYYLAPRIE